jgi:hypothetical protein
VDTEKVIGILNAIAVGLFRVVELLLPLMLVLCMGILKAFVFAFTSANIYRKDKSEKSLLTHLDEI